MKYKAVFFKDGEYIGVEFPELPGCYSQGDNLSEAEQNASKALSRYLEGVGKIPLATQAESADVLSVNYIEPLTDDNDTHILLTNGEKYICYPVNVEMLGEKLVMKIKGMVA